MWVLHLLTEANKLNRVSVLRPVDSTILFFQRDLVIVMILEHTRENRMESICLQFSSPFRVMDLFVSSQELIKVA